MSRSTVRLMLAVAAAMASVPLYFLIGAVLDRSVIRLGDDFPWTLIVGAITSMVIGGCWAAIWRRTIRWTRRRAAVSAGVFVGGWLITAAATYVLKEIFGRGEIEMFMPLAGIAGTLAAVVTVWSETPGERRDRLATRIVPCPTCGYNLAGLKQTGCPECGSEFTVDQIAGMRGSEPEE